MGSFRVTRWTERHFAQLIHKGIAYSKSFIIFITSDIFGTALVKSLHSQNQIILLDSLLKRLDNLNVANAGITPKLNAVSPNNFNASTLLLLSLLTLFMFSRI